MNKNGWVPRLLVDEVVPVMVGSARRSCTGKESMTELVGVSEARTTKGRREFTLIASVEWRSAGGRT